MFLPSQLALLCNIFHSAELYSSEARAKFKVTIQTLRGLLLEVLPDRCFCFEFYALRAGYMGQSGQTSTAHILVAENKKILSPF